MKEYRISDCFPTIRNGASIKQDKISGGIPITRIETISDSLLDLNKLGYAGITDDSFNQFYLQDGDILMSHINSISHLGKIALVKNLEQKIIHGMNLLCLKADREIINPKYAYYYFRTQKFISGIRKITKKSVNQASFNITSFEKLKIKIHDNLNQQIHIPNILTKAESLIQQRKQSIALLDAFLKSTFLEMFGDPVRNEKGWEKVPLKGFGDIITGNTPPRNEADNFSGEFIEWIKTDNIVGNNLIITKAIEYLSEKGLKKSRSVEKGALLVACIAGSIESVGRACLADRKVAFNQQINAIQPNPFIDSYFLYWLFKNSKKYIQNHTNKGMKKILTKGEFEKILMIKPPIELQNQFAHIVAKAETLKQQYQQSLQQLEQLFGSLSQQAFKGELVKEAVVYNIVANNVSLVAEPQVPYKQVASNGLHTDELLQLYFICINRFAHKDKKEEATLGEVKMEKTCHLAEYLISELPFNRTPFKEEYGPADFARLYKLHDFAAANNIFTHERFGNYLKYPLGDNFMQWVKQALSTIPRTVQKKITSLINLLLPLNTKKIDVLATCFAAWNNLLILKQPISISAIAQEGRWHFRKQDFTDADFQEAIDFLNAHNLTPKGEGRLVKEK